MSLRHTTHRLRGALLGAVLALTLSTTLAACGGDSTAAGGSGGNATLKWASSYFPTHWDPVVGGSGAQFRELSLTYASLTRTDEKGDAVPDLAKSWEYNKKGDEITFHLRSGLKFSDGAPVDAAAVKAAVERAQKQ